MKIEKLETTVLEHHDGNRIRVHGLMVVGEGVHLPILYEHGANEEYDHEGHLKELDRQGNDYPAADGALRAWVGHEETRTVDGVTLTMKVCDCQIMFHALSTWEVYVAWWETYEGAESHHVARWQHREPSAAITLPEIQKHVYALIDARLRHHQSAKKHKETIRAIADAHKA